MSALLYRNLYNSVLVAFLGVATTNPYVPAVTSTAAVTFAVISVPALYVTTLLAAVGVFPLIVSVVYSQPKATYKLMVEVTGRLSMELVST